MDFKIILIIIGVLAGVLAFGWLTSGGGPISPQREAGPNPVIREIEFPSQFPATGDEVPGKISFSDPNGDLAKVRFEVVEAVVFEDFSIDLSGAAGIERGAFTFTLHSTLDQEVTLRVILIDRAGHESEPQLLTFRAIGQQNPQ